MFQHTFNSKSSFGNKVPVRVRPPAPLNTMIENSSKFAHHTLCAALTSLTLLGFSTQTIAWGPDGHNSVGILALNQLEPEARHVLESITSPAPLDEQAMIKACNWPDDVRETEEWAWSAPRHYVNIPHGDDFYLESRDCQERPQNPQHPVQQCATEAIKFYTTELANNQNTKEQRWQAFAWLCHLVGDLHQPLHAGFADDRGGNDFDVVFNGEQINLHSYWDHELISLNAGNWQNLVARLSIVPVADADTSWSAESVNDWTDESHQLAKQKAYPETRDIDDSFTQASWELVQQQVNLAAFRLALIINSEFQEDN
jgi:hypothetical protein